MVATEESTGNSKIDPLNSFQNRRLTVFGHVSGKQAGPEGAASFKVTLRQMRSTYC